MIDLRTDFVSRPTPAMIEAMTRAAQAAPGFGLRDDPIVAALERRLDLDRAGAVLDQRDHCICAALTQCTPHELGQQGLLPRSVLYRRIGEMRLRLLAAGIAVAA